MTSARKQEKGFGHLSLILVVLVLLGVGFIGSWVWHQHSGTTANAQLKKALANAQCAGQDTDLCKFFISFNAQKYTTVAFTNFISGRADTGSYETDNLQKYHIAVTNAADTYEVIGIDTTLYSKDPDSDNWWKQSVPRSDIAKYNSTTDSSLTFSAPSSGAALAASYKKLDSVKCPTSSRLTCLKYQVTDPSQQSDTQFIWFDTTYFQLQRVKTITSDGTSDATFGYGKVTLRAPSPIKDLASNQYIVPGQADPVTIPEGGTSGNLEDLLSQYQH